ncbi:TauD/TfdA dioxygenase family protein [Bordetella petrii]|uniref:TauD/TfdA dioxygenase family protein n=1 Tax=Bordetella petrii TaxID=94624 RepID=UPI001A972519|nr:TauD/TfdA family dioxygenase [Bordetella petrii]MBO1114195.1 TauD/TfdA family dioxygenase [Bordetella petrii]
MKLELKPLAASIGAEVLNIDLSQRLDAEAARALDDAFNEHSVLLFRGQNISEGEHIAFSQHFGKLEIHVLRQYLLPDHPEILVISNIEENGRGIGISDAGQYWHTDLSYKNNPSRCSVLYALEIPAPSAEKTYGDTCFVSTVAAFEAMDDEMKSYLQGLQARHHYQARYHKMKASNQARQELTEQQKNEVPPVVHPVVRTHPYTGRKSLYVNEGFTTEIVGLPEADGEKLLGRLFAHCAQEKFMYRHKWRKGDVLMWDNSATQHLAIADYALPQRRRMHRTTVAGSQVF